MFFQVNFIITLIFPILSGILALDQITSVPFQTIFLDANDEEISKLQTTINQQNTTKQAMDFLNSWTDEVYEKNTGVKIAAKSLAESFLDHREGVKDYINYLKGATRVLRYLNEHQIDTMVTRFWKVDQMCFNNFRCTEHNFYSQINWELQTYHENATRDLMVIGEMAYVFPGISERLAFVLES